MFTRINSGGIWAVEGVLVSVEADVSDGLPGFSISGQLASEVRESQERVRTALKNSGFRLPAKKITVNLSPAGIRKGGTAYDLPIAVAILGAFQMVGILLAIMVLPVPALPVKSSPCMPAAATSAALLNMAWPLTSL